MGRWLALLGMAACSPSPPYTPKDTGYRLALDTAAAADPESCRPTIPAPTTVITVAQTLDGPGPFLVCPSVPVTAVGTEVKLFVSEYATATLTGDRAVAYVQAGAQAHASGEQAILVAEQQALVSVAQASSGIQWCASLRWGPAWTEACP